MIIEEDMDTTFWIIVEEERGRVQKDEGGPPTHYLDPFAPLPFVTEHNISVPGRANNGEVEGGRNGTLETHLRLAVKIR